MDVVYDLISDPLFILDRNGLIQDSNKIAQLILNRGNRFKRLPFSKVIGKFLFNQESLDDFNNSSSHIDYETFSAKLIINKQSIATKFKCLSLKEGGFAILIKFLTNFDTTLTDELALDDLKRIIDQTGESILIAKRNGQIEYVNKAFENHTGYSAAEMLGNTPRLLKSGMHTSAFYENLWSAILAGKNWHSDIINSRKDGQLVYDYHSISPIFNSSNEIERFVSISFDVTKQKLQSHAVLEQNEKIKMIADSIPAILFYVDSSGKIKFANRSFEQISDLQSTSIIDQDIKAVLKCPFVDSFLVAYKKMLKGQRESFELKGSFDDGREFFFNFNLIPHARSSGVIVGASVLVTDIKDQKQKEFDLRRKNSILDAISDVQSLFIEGSDLRSIREMILNLLLKLTESEFGFFHESNDSVIRSDKLKVKLYLNDSMKKVEDRLDKKILSDAELQNVGLLLSGISREDGPLVINNLAKSKLAASFKSDSKIKSFFAISLDNGTHSSGALGLANSKSDYNGELLSSLKPFFTTCKNILEALYLEEERQLVEERLIRSQDSLAKAQQIAHVGNWDWRIDEDELTWSNEMYSIFGLDCSKDIASFSKFVNATHPDDLPIVKSHINNAIKIKGEYNLDHRIIRPDKEERYIHAQGEVFCDEDNRAERMVGTVTDITLRKQLENELIEQTRKLQKLDLFKNRLISIVSHDMRSPLTSCIGLADLLARKDSATLSAKQLEIIQTISKSLKWQLELVENFLELSFAERGDIKVNNEKVYPEELFAESIRMLEHLADNKNIKIKVSTYPKKIGLNVDKKLMLQVIGNLLSNAIKFSKSKQTVTLVAKLISKERALISVIDNGVGFKKGEISKVIENFGEHTTIGTAGEHGTGLGLSICNQLATLLGGILIIESSKSKGTKASIELPILESN
ncbi:MAG: PAS domain S-box protein [Nitrospinota bacterium]